MDHYIDIKMLPDPEFVETILLNAVFSKLHRQLVASKNSSIGIAFPNASRTLGDTLRLHGNQLALDSLMEMRWLSGMRDYTEVSAISSVPANCKNIGVRRVQVKSSAERLMRRSVAKGWLTEEQATENLPTLVSRRSKLPFLKVKSQSTGQLFKLFLHQTKPQDAAVGGTFNSYGLSQIATVPTF